MTVQIASAAAVAPQKKRYVAHEKQNAFHAACRVYTDVLFAAGRGCGKTTAGAIEAIMEAVHYNPGSRGLIVAPTYRMLEDATIKEFFNWLPKPEIKHFNRGRMILLLKNGSEIAFRSTDQPDTLRGPNRDWAWMDEPRIMKEREAFDIITAQLRPNRKIFLTTTPGGVFHWLYKVFFEEPHANSAVVTATTWDNPYLPSEYGDRLREQYTDLFAAQELNAEWVSFEGRVFDNFSLEANVTEDVQYNPDLPVHWGVDDGYAQGDGPGYANYHPRVILFGQFNGIGGLDILAEYVKTMEPDYQATIHNALEYGFGAPELASVDSSAVMFRAALSNAGIANVGATHRVSEGIRNVRRLICDGNGMRLLRIHPRCKNLIREMQTYRLDDNSMQSSGGEMIPLKVDDHGVDALRYLAWRLHYS